MTLQQILNNLRPTRNLKAKYILQSKKIKRTTDQFEAGIISIWQFIQIVSSSSAIIFELPDKLVK